ncbi:hypothetical protein HY030_04370 [Candidatus Gottesmanbacteria bacterium]|nr:hypothetical protein [Candidatus Gottesmanbacteria bacterium]
MRKVFYAFFYTLILLYLNSLIPRTYAAGEFLSSYNVSYQIMEDGNTIVEEQISLTNELTTRFSTEAEITLGSPNIYNISAYDNIGKIFIKVSKVSDETKVHAVFNEKVVGVGKTYVWHLKYETPDLVSLNGLVKEINIHKLELNPDIEEYNLTIRYPESFGQVLYVKPGNQPKLFFNKNDLAKSQISIAFGSYQVFNFKLNYGLKNPKITPIYTEIALPPDTNYQKVFLKTLVPAPLDVTLDPDGNWLAKYQLGPEQKLTVLATGSAQIFSRPQKQEESLNFNALKSLSLPQKYWESDNEKIKALAKQLGSIKDIYNYAVKFLKYDYNRVVSTPQRLGAKFILEHPENAICMEFTDLFISLGRSLGTSVREVDGFAYTNNSKLKPLSLKKDVLHSWPEYYDESKKVWREVDPTWENTSGVDYFNEFDLNHFAFVKRGRNSQYPYPAGAYKTNGDEAKDVEVTFGKSEDLERRDKIEMSLTVSSLVYAGFSYEGTLIIKNRGNNQTEKKVLTLKGNNLEITSALTTEIPPIPPFGQREYKIAFKGSAPSQDAFLTAFLGSDNISKEINIKPLTIIYLLPTFALVAIVGLLIAFYLYRKVWNRKS